MHRWYDHKQDYFDNRDDGGHDGWDCFCLVLYVDSEMQLDQRKKEFLRHSLYLATVHELFIL